MNFVKRKAFTLVELLVVIGIIAVLIAILLPVLSSVRQQAISMKCLANLRTCGQAMIMYTDEHKGIIPMPTTNPYENLLWYTVIDPYLNSIANTNRGSGVLSQRSFSEYKQCPLVNNLFGLANGSTDGETGTTATINESTRSYKMNAFLRHSNPAPANTYYPAKITQVPNVSNFVLLGDGISMDVCGYVTSVTESTAFSMDPDANSGATSPWPLVRHKGACNILFVDGHAESVKLATIQKTLSANAGFTVVPTVTTWQPEFVNSAGTTVNVNGSHLTAASIAGLQRNPMMPLQWSDIPNLTR